MRHHAQQDRLRPLPPYPLRTAVRAVKAMRRPESPLLAQLVVIRRCNLSCGYCNEYDDHSPPVPREELFARVDHLAELGCLVLTLTGGEPFMHPNLDEVVARAVSHGMVVTSISNAYPITKGWIERMNDAGLSLLQVSVDNVEPNEVSQKSWSKIKKRLLLLKEHAKFKLNVNAVLGSSPPRQTRELIDEIRSLGFYMTVGLLHDQQGQIDPGLIGDILPEFYEEMQALCNKSFFHRFGEGWEQKMLRGGTAPWRCRAGARYLYVDEYGKVAYCSQRRSEPGIALLDYTREDLKREFDRPKGCEESCTIACVRRASSLDEWRPQRGPVPFPKVTLPTV
ncbi:MAG: radical SAM protein [Deltaproteobacteria bacterium]|jgi:MoaA/NifB/PqqE/SkfB family radical SAM enzyme|nr:radical SAM protein [Deltaproteobacteria bacterium]